MKKFLILFVSMAMISLASMSQTITLSPEDLQKLDPSVKAQIDQLQAQKEITGTLETASKWAGLGKEIGITVKESLEAVVDVSDKFSKTDVGKFTLFLVFYKVAGADFLQLIIGFIWIGIVLIVSYRMYRNNLDRTVLVSKKWNKEGKGWDKEYKIIEGQEDLVITAIVIFCIGLIAALPIIFV